MSRTWLLSWNPRNWDWTTYSKNAENTKKGISFLEPWTCANTHVEIGDRVFLIKLGEDPRGIMASGHVIKVGYPDAHWDPEKEKQGIKANHIDVEFDLILDYHTETILTLPTLKAGFPEQHWDSQSSGIEIKNFYIDELEKIWKSVTDARSETLLDKLKKIPEMIPDEHDGSYELMRETIKAYSNVNDLSGLDYLDLNTVYLMAIGTWKHSAEQKKKTINKSHLDDKEKKHLVEIVDSIYEKAKAEKYSNLSEGSKVGFGMFGTGFYTFQRTTNNESVQNFIKLCTDIIDLKDDDDIFNRAEKVLNSNFRGMKAGSASVILHCIKPMTFPILNRNMGNADIYKILGIGIVEREALDTYIGNCRKIKIFMENNLPFRNYRILDIEARKLPVKQLPIKPIDFEAIEDFLTSYSGIKYIKPENAGDDSDLMNQIKEIGTNSVKQFNKIGSTVKDNFHDFQAGKCSSWVNQHQDIPEYLWIELKKKGKETSQTSISLCAKNYSGTIKFYVAVEARDKKITSEELKKHNRIIYRNLENGLHYEVKDLKGQNVILQCTQKEAIRNYEDNEFSKIRLQRNISGPYTAERTKELLEEIYNSIKILELYYDVAVNDIQDLIPFSEESNNRISIYEYIARKGYQFSGWTVTDYILSLATKPLVILSGISGTGKTKLAQLLSEYIAPDIEIEAKEDTVPEALVGAFTHRVGRSTLKWKGITVPNEDIGLFEKAPDRGESIELQIDVQYFGKFQGRLRNVGYTERSSTTMQLFWNKDLAQIFINNLKLGDYLICEPQNRAGIQSVSIRIHTPNSVKKTVPSECIAFLAVRPDWTDNRALLGYYNPLTQSYQSTELLRLLLHAKENEKESHFVILDEMNLAKVEYYFSDFLSAMEAGTEMVLHDVNDDGIDREIPLPPKRIKIPSNVFFTGTVNVDETTYMFSPKVLDRANTMELDHVDLNSYGKTITTDTDDFCFHTGISIDDILKNCRNPIPADWIELSETYQGMICEINAILQKYNLHFGYRVANEIARYLGLTATYVGVDQLNVAFDLQVLQKVLPKTSGSRTKLEEPLKELIKYLQERNMVHSGEKVEAMLKTLCTVGFVSFVE